MTHELQQTLVAALDALEDARDAEEEAHQQGLDTDGLDGVLAKAAHAIEMYIE